MGVWASYSPSGPGVVLAAAAYVRSSMKLHNAAIWLQPPPHWQRGVAAADPGPWTAAWRAVLDAACCIMGCGSTRFFIGRYAHRSTRWRSVRCGIALQALLLMLAGLRRVRDSSWSARLRLYPPGQILSGRACAAEVFGGPRSDRTRDPGFPDGPHGRVAWLLAVIPLLWCLLSALTHVGMGLYIGVLTPRSRRWCSGLPWPGAVNGFEWLTS